MNFYKIYLLEIQRKLINNKSKIGIFSKKDLENISVEKPPDKFDFDFSSNAAMVLSKKTKQNPKHLAELIKSTMMEGSKEFSSISIAGPGFLNFKLSNLAWLKIIKNILMIKKKYGSIKSKKKYNIEFVSSNPTGPLHVGHCRGAVFGDVLTNLVKFNGNKVVKEFYINDYGSQIDNFTKSVFLRMREIKFDEPFPNDNNLYPGNYIKDIAQKIMVQESKINLNDYKKIYKKLKKNCLKYSMNLIKSDLNKLGIKHDYFFSESKLVTNNYVKKTINKLKKDNYVEFGFLNPPKGEEIKDWKKTKRLIFKSSRFGDDTDRALQKNDGSWTYFANDVAYHDTKVNKKYDYLINVLGADHTGYIKRISAAVEALSKKKIILICKVCQLVKLFKNGEPYKMSKRQGDFISVEDLLKEVGKDSVRFMMLNRGNDSEIDFDFAKVQEKNKDNPVFYVQYCYARINSLFRSLKINLNHKINIDIENFDPNEFEYKLLRKIIEWPKIIDQSYTKLEPHRIPFYLYDLATIFHSYWSKGNENMKYKFIYNGQMNNPLSFVIFQLISIILENGMTILGVSLPKKM